MLYQSHTVFLDLVKRPEEFPEREKATVLVGKTLSVPGWNPLGWPAKMMKRKIFFIIYGKGFAFLIKAS